MGKFWNKNKTAVAGGLIGILAICGFVSLGYYYSNSDIGYDYVGVGAQVDSLNYNTGNGNNYRITTSINEGLIVSSVDYGTLQSEITTALTEGWEGSDPLQNSITANELTSIQEYTEATRLVLATYADDYKTDRVLFDTLNDNEKTVVILAASGDVNLDYATRILVHGRPITYIGDDAGESADVPEWMENPTSGNMYSPFGYGVADMIYTNEDYTEYRFRMRDGTLDDGVARWQTWEKDGEEQVDRVSAADVAFGFSRQMPSMYGSSGRYMYTTYSTLVGSSEMTKVDQNYELTDDGRYITPEATPGSAEEAIYYGLAPDSDTRINAVDQVETFTDFGSQKKTTGILFYDPGDEDEEVTSTSEYSYLDFNLTQGNKKFGTMMASTGFWPVNWEWFVSTLGNPDIDAINLMATSAKTSLSNGAQQVTEFDNLYGYSTVKNENYYDADLVTAEKTSYRMISEASTQVAMFDNGDATYITGADSNSKVINDNENVSEWKPDKFTKPATKFMFFNLGLDRLEYGDDLVKNNAKYTSDPNFRRAFTYAFNANTYHELNSTNTANAVSTFEPLGFYDAFNRDFVDHMSDTTYTTQAYDSADVDATSEQLEYFDSEARIEARQNGIDFSDEDLVDPTQNYQVADYYFQEFLNDMEKLGVDVEETITLKYLTSVGANDPFIKAIQQDIETHVFPGGHKIKVQIEQVNSGVFFPAYYGADYDLASIQWSADYLDTWSNIGIFNISETERGGNSTAGWNFWDGSDYTFDDSVYGEENTALARQLFNDGMVQFYEGNDLTGGETNPNITSLEYSGETGTYTTSDFVAIGQELWNAVLSDNGIATWEEGIPLANVFDTNYDLTYGLNYFDHTEDIWSDPAKELAANIIFETLLKDGAATVTGTTESKSISPSRALLEGDPAVGYEIRSLSFDLTKAKGFWKDVEKELKDEFFKN